MHNASISLKEKRKINVPTEFYFTNILLNSYFLALGPSNIDFPPQFTPEIDIRSFFQFPVPPCLGIEKITGNMFRCALGASCITIQSGGYPDRRCQLMWEK